MVQVHASCVEVAGTAVLIRGPAGAGKSDLALRLIDGGARLVADDRVDLVARDGAVLARAPAAIAGLIEVRGLGVVRLDAAAEARVGLIVELTAAARVERLPEGLSEDPGVGVALPVLRLAPFEASAAAKVRLAAAALGGGIGVVATSLPIMPAS